MDARSHRNLQVGTFLATMFSSPPHSYSFFQQPRDVPTAVNALLDATRKLEVALQRWCNFQGTEVEVSDIYVTVGNEFHAMVASFAYFNIDMRYVAIHVLTSLHRRLQGLDLVVMFEHSQKSSGQYLRNALVKTPPRKTSTISCLKCEL